MTTVLVTGATGFLGSSILAAAHTQPDLHVIAAARDASRVPDWFDGEVRVGDLTDPDYRISVLEGIDVVLHAGTWSTFWGHASEERRLFLEPTLDFIDQAIQAGVSRLVMASTVALSTPAAGTNRVEDDAPAVQRGYWPHLDMLVEVEDHMRHVAGTTQMISLRLGHFVGPGSTLALIPALVPRLKTGLVPWINHGRAHLPLVSGQDMAQAFVLAAQAADLEDFESINIIGPEQPTMREVFTFIAANAGVKPPRYSVPGWAAHAFAALMEAFHPLTRAKAPFLTRALVHVAQNWHADTCRAMALGYHPTTPWQDAALASIDERRSGGFAWPALAQTAP